MQVQPHPPLRVAVPSGGGGASPRLRGGGGSLLWPSGIGGGRGGGGGGWGGRPPAPSGVGLPSVVSGVPPWGILVTWGLPGGRGRRVRSGRRPMGQCGGGGGGGGALVRAPVFSGPASEGAAPFAPSWAPPVRRRPAAGRACGRLPRPWCPLTPGAAASSGGVQGRRFFSLPPSALGPGGEGGGDRGGPSGPLGPAPPPTFSRPPSGPSPAPPLVWGLGLWRRRVAPAVAPVGEGAAQGPGEPVVRVRVHDAKYRPPFQEGRPRRPPVGPRCPDY